MDIKRRATLSLSRTQQMVFRIHEAHDRVLSSRSESYLDFWRSTWADRESTTFVEIYHIQILHNHDFVLYINSTHCSEVRPFS